MGWKVKFKIKKYAARRCQVGKIFSRDGRNKTKGAAGKLDIERRRYSSLLRKRRKWQGKGLETPWEGAWEGEEFQDEQLSHSSYDEVIEFAESEESCWIVKDVKEEIKEKIIFSEKD